MARPFVYIAAVRRSGSKLLSTLLMQPPHRLILREPGLVRNKFRLKEQELALLHEYGITFDRPLDKHAAIRGPQAWDVFFDEVLPVLQERFGQIGIKEIWHDRAEVLLSRLGTNRVIVTARDPRDIYLSLHRNREKFAAMGRRKANFPGGFNPRSVAAHLNEQFAAQRRLLEQHRAIKLRYEDLCLDTATNYDKVCEHIEAEAVGPPDLKGKTDNLGGVFGEHVNADRIYTWQNLTGGALLEQAKAVADLMPEYRSFWNYR